MSNKENIELTKARVQVYEIIFTMIIKSILVIAGLFAFFIVLYFLIETDDNTTRMIYGCFDIILGGSIFVVYRHYFPDKK